MHTYLSLRKRGFTIIELLTVIAIIGLLTGLAATSYINAQRNARDNARKTNVDNIASAVESYNRVTQTFPGLVGNETGNADKSLNAPVISDAGTWAGCLALDSTNKSVVYYYFPNQPKGSAGPYIECGSRANAVTGFTPSQYQPASTWIPNLGSYLNPIPVERRYQNDSGDTSAIMDPPAGFSDVLTTSGGSALSLFYRHLPGGYMVYTRLENTTTDTVTNPTTFTDQPQYCGTITGGICQGAQVKVTNDDIYMVRR